MKLFIITISLFVGLNLLLKSCTAEAPAPKQVETKQYIIFESDTLQVSNGLVIQN